MTQLEGITVVLVDQHKNESKFSQLSPDVMHDILCFLSVDDYCIHGFLRISKNITFSMLGNISSVDELESKRDVVNSSQYYTTLSYLSMRKNIERYEEYVRKRQKFIKFSGDYKKTEKKIKEKWANYTEEQKKNMLSSDYVTQNRHERDFKKRIQAKMGELSSSKVFYRLTSAIANLNKLFPYWLSPSREFSDMSLMKTYISQHLCIDRVYKTLFSVKTVNTPVLFLGNDEEQLHNTIDTKLNKILFDNKRFSKSVNKCRDWKLIFEKQLEKDSHVRLMESILKIHKFCRRERHSHRRDSVINSVSIFKTELNNIKQILSQLDEKTRLNYLFEKNFAHGKRSVHLDNHPEDKNGFIGLLPDLMFLFISVRKIFKTRNKENNQKKSEHLIKFILFTLENWKIFYRKHKDENATDSEIIRDFLLDGSRLAFRTLFLLEEVRLIDWALNEFKEVFEQYFPISQFQNRATRHVAIKTFCVKAPRIREKTSELFESKKEELI